MVVLVLFLLLFVILISTSVFIWRHRKSIDEMHGMMVGMGLGMISSLLVGTLYVFPKGDFLTGTILGSSVGVSVGVIFGRLGGHLGVMEGIMAGPMGGMMGAMLGQMVRPYSAEIFLPFFAAIIVMSLAGLVYTIQCGVSCCGKEKKQSKVPQMPQKFILSWVIIGLVVIAIIVMLSSQGEQKKKSSDVLRLPKALQVQERRAVAELIDGVQVVNMVIENSQYHPNVLVFKQGLPARINIESKESAGCGSDIVIPEYKIRKIVPPGTRDVVEFTPTNTGVFKFSCSMDMAQGKIIVE